MRKSKRKRFSPANLVKLAQRAEVLDRTELVDHLDTSLSLLTRYIAEYRRTREPNMLAEAKLSAEATYAMLEELLSRDEPPPITAEEERFPKMQRARQAREHY
jgi:hypothetical protein